MMSSITSFQQQTEQAAGKKLLGVNDENLGKALKAKVQSTTMTKRSALGDLANQKIDSSKPTLKPTDHGKIQKPTIKKSVAVKPRAKVPTKPSSTDSIGHDANMDEIDAIIDNAGEQGSSSSEETQIEQEIELDSHGAAVEEEESYSAKLQRLGIPDIDLEDASDPLAVTDYVVSIFGYLRGLEDKYQPPSNYMSNQTDITWGMRSTLVTWLVEVHFKYKLYPETLFLTISIMDRFLALKKVFKDKLQLVGVASMLIASKFEEIYSPSVQDFTYICNDSYPTEELLRMERSILYALEFRLGSPCPLTFLRRISKAEQYDIPSRTVAKYLIEVTILDEKFLAYKPSMLAAASTWLARKMLKKGPWEKSLEFYSGYSETQLESCVNDLLSFLQKNTKHRSVYKKYSSSKFLRASLFVEQKINAWMNNEDGPTPPSDLSNE